jgi:hypothetical protein
VKGEDDKTLRKEKGADYVPEQRGATLCRRHAVLWKEDGVAGLLLVGVRPVASSRRPPIVVVPSSTRRLASLQRNEKMLQHITGLVNTLVVRHCGLFAHRSDVMLATQKKSTKKKNWQTNRRLNKATKAL